MRMHPQLTLLAAIRHLNCIVVWQGRSQPAAMPPSTAKAPLLAAGCSMAARTLPRLLNSSTALQHGNAHQASAQKRLDARAPIEH